MPDHCTCLLVFRPTQSMADLMQDVKAGSSQWINANKFCRGRFEWQSGYGAFSHSKSQLPDVVRYIENQKEHHRKQTFLDEYQLFLDKFEVDYGEKYIFHDPEEVSCLRHLLEVYLPDYRYGMPNGISSYLSTEKYGD